MAATRKDAVQFFTRRAVKTPSYNPLPSRKAAEMERYRLSALMKDVEMGGDIDVVIAADAQRALDAEREKAKQLDRTLADVYQQRDGLQAQLAQPIRVCQGCGRVSRDGWVPSRYECDELNGSLQCPDCQCIDLEINTAKELATLCTQAQAQLRQVEGERDHAKKMEAVQKEVADNQTWHVQKLKDWRDTVTLALQRPGGARFEDVPEHIKALVKEHATLRQLVEVAVQRWRAQTNAQEGISFKLAMKDLEAATLAAQVAQDAGKEDVSHD